MKKENIDITAIINKSGCFDLQFRKDTKHKRLNSPTYYRWKVQFVVINTKEVLEKIIKEIGCGKIYTIGNQERYSVQNIDEIKNNLIPYLRARQLSEIKNNNFKLWEKAVEIIYKNKGKISSTWKKEDFQKLIEIQKAMKKYKEKPKIAKWTATAEELAKTL